MSIWIRSRWFSTIPIAFLQFLEIFSKKNLVASSVGDNVGTDSDSNAENCIKSNLFLFLTLNLWFTLHCCGPTAINLITWSQNKIPQNAKFFGLWGHSSSGATHTEEHIPHTHLPLSLEKLSDFSFPQKRKGGGRGGGGGVRGGEGREPRIECERKASLTVAHRWYHRAGVCWDQWRRA